MYISRHAAERLTERFSAGETGLLVDRARASAERGRRIAVVLDRQPVLRSTGLDRYGDRASNGDLTVGIVAWNPGDPAPTLVTVMYRRSSQPLDPRRLDADRLVYSLA